MIIHFIILSKILSKLRCLILSFSSECWCIFITASIEKDWIHDYIFLLIVFCLFNLWFGSTPMSGPWFRSPSQNHISILSIIIIALSHHELVQYLSYNLLLVFSFHLARLPQFFLCNFLLTYRSTSFTISFHFLSELFINKIILHSIFLF